MHVLYDKATGTHKGAAFCTYATAAEAQAAINAFHQKHTLPPVRLGHRPAPLELAVLVAF